MNRLTKRYDNGFVTINADNYAETQETIDSTVRNSTPIADAVKRLAEYEDAEEQGLLVQLPCKVGDTVYVICEQRRKREKNGEWAKGIVRRVVDRFDVFGSSVWIRFGRSMVFPIDYIGKAIFFTREEAENAMKRDKYHYISWCGILESTETDDR